MTPKTEVIGEEQLLCVNGRKPVLILGWENSETLDSNVPGALVTFRNAPGV